MVEGPAFASMKDIQQWLSRAAHVESKGVMLLRNGSPPKTLNLIGPARYCSPERSSHFQCFAGPTRPALCVPLINPFWQLVSMSVGAMPHDRTTLQFLPVMQ